MAGKPNHIQIALDSIEDYSVPAEVDARYGFANNKSLSGPTPFGADRGIGGIYDTRDDLVGSTNTRWNRQPSDVSQPSGASFASYSESASTFNSGSGLNGERTKFSDVLSVEDLAGGVNADSPYGH